MRAKILYVIFAAVITIGILTGCSAPYDSAGKIQVVCSMYPQYDFAKAVFGDRAEVVLLLPPGVESHSYDPKPQDILRVARCDLFLYTGGEGEPWAARILSGMENVKAVDLSAGVNLMELDEDEHEHEGHSEHSHGHEYDPHIWTNPVIAQQMVRDIAAAAGELDPQNGGEYSQNAESYCCELAELDTRLREIAANAVRKRLIFGGRFAFGYLTREYGLEWEAAYDSCSHESEPSITAIIEIISDIREEDIPIVYYEELTDPAVARLISEETGAEIRLLHSGHNLSSDERRRGEDFLSIMRRNVDYIEEGLS